MLDVTVQITIDRPIGVVSAYAADPANAVHWLSSVTSAKWRGAPGTAVGAQIAFSGTYGGRHLERTYQVLEYAAGSRLVMRTEEGPFPEETTYTWAPASSGTLMTLRSRSEPTGLARLLTPLTARTVRRANLEDLGVLKGVLEGRPVS